MAIDRIEKTDPSLYRVEQAGDQQGRRGQQQEQKKEKDKFEKKPSVWRRVFAKNAAAPRGPASILAGKPQGLPIHTVRDDDPEPEQSLTLSERLLVAWGVIHRDGRPRPTVILSYVLVLGMILGATLLIIGMSLWP